jgi:hypothetical protein
MNMKTLGKLFFCVGLALTLSAYGCASTPGDRNAAFFKAEAGYTAVLQAASQYVALPRCPEAKPICSDQAVVDAIRPAANSADATVQSAEDLIRNHPDIDAQFAIDAATAAVQSLSTILTTYHVGGL